MMKNAKGKMKDKTANTSLTAFKGAVCKIALSSVTWIVYTKQLPSQLGGSS